MKATLRQMNNAYEALKGATINSLDHKEQAAIFRINRAIYAHVTRYDEERKDVSERLKPADYEELIEINQRRLAGKCTNEEAVRCIVGINAHDRAVSKHLTPLLDEEYELKVEPIAEDTWRKVMKENSWPFEKYNAVDIFMVHEEEY